MIGWVPVLKRVAQNSASSGSMKLSLLLRRKRHQTKHLRVETIGFLEYLPFWEMFNKGNLVGFGFPEVRPHEPEDEARCGDNFSNEVV